jgi:dsDNA-specific endonuclease/ATPase MutS2
MDEKEMPEEVVLPIEDFIDLHPFQPREIRSVVEAYLEAALDMGFREVRIIHGKGIGVQREAVRSVLRSHPNVERFSDGGPAAGGWGATRVVLLPSGDGADQS